MSFYQLTLQATASNQQVNNVFHYITTSLLPSNEEAANLNAEFITDVLPRIRALLHTSWTANMVYTIAPQQVDVFAAFPFTAGSTPGLRGGDALPLFVAWGLETSRQRRDIRNGYKRFSPISELDQTGGQPVGGILGLLNDLRNALNANLELEYGGGGSTASMVIVKRVRYNPDPERPNYWSYRIPGPGDPLVYYEANQWVFDRITTQNTRKIGVGS